MKFLQLFPTAKRRGDDFDYNGDGYFRGDVEGYCVQCGEKTDWISINFECFVCSTECSECLVNEYFESEKKPPHKNTFMCELKNTKTEIPEFEKDVLILYPYQNISFWVIGKLHQGNNKFGHHFGINGNTVVLWLCDYDVYWVELPDIKSFQPEGEL